MPHKVSFSLCNMSLLPPKLVLGNTMDTAHQDEQAMREKGVGSPEAPAGCRDKAEGDSGSRSWGPDACIWPSRCRKAWPFPNRDCSNQPQRSLLPLTTPYVYSSGKPKFICQIQDTTLTVPGFSFCLFLITSGRALLKGKWCVLTGQGPPPGARKCLPRVSHESHCPACHRLSLLILTARLPPQDV